MESRSRPAPLTFCKLQRLLINAVVSRLNNGDITERQLARLVGISQPQIHNVLKEKRRLQPEVADRLLQKLEIDLYDLLHDDISAYLERQSRPDLAGSSPSRKSPGRVVGETRQRLLFGS